MANQPVDPESGRFSRAPSGELIARVREGDSRALSALFRRQGADLLRWARGRLPRWARRLTDTADLVQDALIKTFRQLDRFEDRGRGALQGYLRQAVRNRINDELRRIGRRPQMSELSPDLTDPGATPFETTLDAEQTRRYKEALATLTEGERFLVVARLELGYSYEQLALARGRSTPEAARQAVRRAVEKLAESMSRE